MKWEGKEMTKRERDIFTLSFCVGIPIGAIIALIVFLVMH